MILKRFKTLLAFAKSHKNKIIIAAISAALASLAGLVPFYLVAVIGEGIYLDALGSEEVNVLVIVSIGALIARYVFFSIAKGLSHLSAYLTMYDLQISLSEKIGRMPLGRVTEEGSVKLKKTILQDTDVTHTIIGHYLEDFLTGILIPSLTLIAFYIVDWKMGLAATAILPFVYWAYKQSFKNFDKEAEAYFKANEEMQGSFSEFINGITAVKIFNKDLSHKLVRSTEDYVTHIVNWTKKTMLSWSLFNSFAEASLLFILPAGLIMLSMNLITLNVFFFFVILGINYLQPLIRLSIQMGFLNYASKSIERIDDLLNENVVPTPQEPKQPSGSEILVQDIHFSHGEKEVIKGVSFDVKEGETCAIIGPSGAGKSTLAQLIGRFWDVEKGQISLGGINLKDIEEETLYENIAFVFQDVFLFKGSIKDNLRLAKPDASEEEIIEACKKASAHQFIMQFPEGYDSEVGERGMLLSGGQKQRISIARAILRDAPVLILDEATAYADPINEADIQRALNNLMQGRTIIMIAHRLSTIMDADKIILLDQGKINAIGTHDSLLDRSELYQQLWHDYQSYYEQKSEIEKERDAA